MQRQRQLAAAGSSYIIQPGANAAAAAARSSYIIQLVANAAKLESKSVSKLPNANGFGGASNGPNCSFLEEYAFPVLRPPPVYSREHLVRLFAKKQHCGLTLWDVNVHWDPIEALVLAELQERVQQQQAEELRRREGQGEGKGLHKAPNPWRPSTDTAQSRLFDRGKGKEREKGRKTAS